MVSLYPQRTHQHGPRFGASNSVGIQPDISSPMPENDLFMPLSIAKAPTLSEGIEIFNNNKNVFGTEHLPTRKNSSFLQVDVTPANEKRDIFKKHLNLIKDLALHKHNTTYLMASCSNLEEIKRILDGYMDMPGAKVAFDPKTGIYNAERLFRNEKSNKVEGGMNFKGIAVKRQSGDGYVVVVQINSSIDHRIHLLKYLR